jgi:hypothetical protein
MRSIVKLLKTNQDGYAMMTTMMILVLLTVIGMAATNTSNVELEITTNSKEIVEDFYVSEGSVVWALENADNWLSIPLIQVGEAIHENKAVSDYSIGGWSGNVDFDGDNEDDALIESRVLTNVETTIPGLGASGNDVPVQIFKGPAPPNSGYSSTDFIIRKFSVTATSLRGGTDIQAGTWKVFNTP